VVDFYTGKTIRIVVSTSPGGGFDIYSRMIARHMRKYIPGNPTMIVENMPGAGHMLAMNHVYNVAAKDGTTIGNVGGGLALEQLFNTPGVEFDMSKVRYLGVPTSDNMVMIVSKKSSITRVEEIFPPSSRQAVVAGAGPGSLQEDIPLLMRDVMGANIKLVSGYAGTTPMKLALEQGEADAFFNSWESVKTTDRDKVESGEWLLPVQFTEQPIRDLPNVPLISPLAKTDEQRQLLRYGVILRSQFVRPYLLAPGVPPDRAAALEAAFMKTLEDQEFLAEAQRGQLDIAPLTGDHVHKLVVEFLTMPEDIKAKLQSVMRPPGR
jgi:tripartite-type tricarboxylate transporter receptor subunit TctC